MAGGYRDTATAGIARVRAHALHPPGIRLRPWYALSMNAGTRLDVYMTVPGR
jgi:hypothetical protein